MNGNKKINSSGPDKTAFELAVEKKFGTSDVEKILKEKTPANKPKSAKEIAEHFISAILGPEEEKLVERISYSHSDLVDQRLKMMKHWPEGLVLRGHVVQDKETGTHKLKNHSNLDGEACLFFFRYILGFGKRVGAEEGKYINKTKYIFPGGYLPQAINIDTSWGTHGAELDMDEMALAIDHHAKDSSRNSSVFKILYEQYKKDGLLDKIMHQKEEKEALQRLVDFVTAVDNYNLPSGLSWETLWKTADRNLFAICLGQQYSVKIERLFDFFKKNKFENAFSSLSPAEINRILGPAAYDEKEGKSVTFVERQKGLKEKGEKFFNERKGFTLFSPSYGKILVTIGESAPGGAFSAFGHGYDALLVWQPQKKSYFFNVRPGRNIPHSLRDELGENQAVWVRGAMLLQPDWRSQQLGLEKLSFSLTELLPLLGVDLDKDDEDVKEFVSKVKEMEKMPEGKKNLS